MSIKRQWRGSMFRLSWGMCLLLSVLVHALFLAGSSVLPAGWLGTSPSPREEKRAAKVVGVRVVRTVERREGAKRQTPEERLPAIVKTNEEQESATRPETPEFASNRNTRSEGGRKDPDDLRAMPAQDGIERENGEIVLFDQERQDGDMSHERDGNRNARQHASASEPYQPLAQAAPPEGSEDAAETTPSHMGVPREAMLEEGPAREDLLQGRKERDEHVMQLPRAVMVPQPGGPGDPEKTAAVQELAKKISSGVERPPLNLPQLPLPPNARPVQKQPLYDPMFNVDSQPGFKTNERKTRQKGSFSFGRRPTLDVEATPMGTYQTVIYRLIGEQWYRQCEINRDLIVAGTVRIRLLIGHDGKVKSMTQTSRVGAGEVQKSFTFLAIKLAKLPAMPPEVRKAIVGESLEMYFDFNF